MSDSLSDSEIDTILSQINADECLPVASGKNGGFFDVESDFILSQFDVDAFLKEEEKLGHIPYSQNVNTEPTQEKNNERFTAVATTSEVENVRSLSTPENTQKNTRWGLNVWDQWGKWRNDLTTKDGLKESSPYVLVPPLSAQIEAHELNYWMCRFIIEVRRQDGQNYPSESLRLLCTSLWWYLRDNCRRYDLNFFDRKKVEFADIRECLDSRLKDLDRCKPHVKKQAEPVNASEEEALWNKVFTRPDARSLQYAVYFYACKVFGLRAADEHAHLTVDQFQFGSDEEGKFVCFRDGKSKTVQGGIFHKKVDPKSVKHYESKENPRCVVKLFRTYLELIPGQ